MQADEVWCENMGVCRYREFVSELQAYASITDGKRDVSQEIRVAMVIVETCYC
jgi:hypothetical protein